MSGGSRRASSTNRSAGHRFGILLPPATNATQGPVDAVDAVEDRVGGGPFGGGRLEARETILDRDVRRRSRPACRVVVDGRARDRRVARSGDGVREERAAGVPGVADGRPDPRRIGRRGRSGSSPGAGAGRRGRGGGLLGRRRAGRAGLRRGAGSLPRSRDARPASRGWRAFRGPTIARCGAAPAIALNGGFGHHRIAEPVRHEDAEAPDRARDRWGRPFKRRDPGRRFRPARAGRRRDPDASDPSTDGAPPAVRSR